MVSRNVVVRVVVGTMLLGCFTAIAASKEPAEPEAAEWQKPIPISFSIDYTLVSDYVWRGLNLSEYAGEGREKPNHQMGITVEYDTGTFGTFGGNIWFEWYTAQDRLTSSGDHNQEIDYTLYWSYGIDELGLNVEMGWIDYVFPVFAGDGRSTQEVYVSLSYDDSRLFGTEEPVLNPQFSYYLDVDDVRGSWMEFGISHGFALGEIDCLKGCPVLKDITLTPSLVLGIDHRYLQKTTKLANLTYGLNADYDISGALGLPEACGSITLTGFLNFSQALEDEVLNDEFYGGMTIGYAW